MKNLRVYMPLVNDEQMVLEYVNGRLLINKIASDNFGAAPRSLVFEAKTADGRTVRLVIPYSENDPARVLIEGD